MKHVKISMVIQDVRTFSIIISQPYTKGSLKERQAQPHKIRQIFILGNPHGGENPTKLPQYILQPSKM